MPLNQLLVQQLSQNSPDLPSALELDDPTISDDDIAHLAKIFPKNSHIESIHINTHNLTHKSYPIFLELVESNPSITNFNCSLIKPINLADGMYNQSIRTVLSKNREAKKRKMEAGAANNANTEMPKNPLDLSLQNRLNGLPLNLTSQIPKAKIPNLSSGIDLTFVSLPSVASVSGSKEESDPILKPACNIDALKMNRSSKTTR